MRQYWLNRSNLLLFLILTLALLLRVYLSLDEFLHTWDERFHALVAKNLLDNPLKPLLYKTPVFPYNTQDWFTNHIWLHKQPLPLWLMSLSIKCFGLHEFVIRIPSILLSTLAVYFTYYIGKNIFNARVGLLAAFFHATNGLLIEMCAGRIATDHYDTLFLVFIEAALYFVIIQTKRKTIIWSALIGLCIGLAILTKWLPALIVLPVWYLLSKNYFPKKKLILQGIIIIATSIIISLPWQLYIMKNFPIEASYSYNHNLKHITEVLDNQEAEWYYYFYKILVNYSEIIYFAIILFGIALFKHKKINAQKAALLVWISIPVLFFSFVSTKMQGYIMFVSPALFIIYAYFINYLLYKRYTIQNKTTKIILTVLITSSFLLPLRYLTERIKLFESYNRNPKWSSVYKTIANETNKSKEKLVFINVEHPIEFMFYSKFPAYVKKTISDEEKKRYPAYSFVRLDDIQNQE